MRPLALPQLLEAQAALTPDAAAVAAPGRTPLSYGRLYAQVCEASAALGEAGVGRGGRVAVVLPNGPEMAVTFLAVAARAACAPLNPAYSADEFDFYLSDLTARALVIQEGFDSPARSVARARGIPVVELSPRAEQEAGAFTLRCEARTTHRDGGGAPPSSNLAQTDDVALVLHTSGTTSRPKMVPLSHRNLCASAHSIRDALALTADDRCLNVMPLFHIHGLVGAVLASLAAGAAVVCTPGFYAPDFFRWLAQARPTWYTAVPTMHQAILSRAHANREIIEANPLRFIRSSSAPLPPRVAAELECAFGAPVVEAYGMTEAAHQMTSNPLPPRARKAGSVGVATGVEVRVMDEAGELLPPCATGEVVIRGPSVTRGYENNPAANEGAFKGGWFRTGDLGKFDDEGYLFLTGRLKEIINRGGEKISPREVDEALLEHPAVAQALTFAVPHPELGEDVAAAVVLGEKEAATGAELRAFTSQRLAYFKVPRRILFLDEIPKGATGKLQRVGLADKLGLAALVPKADEANGARYAPARTPVEEAVVRLWAEVLSVERVGVHDNFFQLGGDSMLATRLVSRVRELMRVELSLTKLFETPTPADMASDIESLLIAELEASAEN